MTLTKATFSMIESAPFSVDDYGAVGNGVNDDAAAIQAAIDAANAAGGGTVYFTPGKNYAKTVAINLKANVNLFSPGTAYVTNTVSGQAGFANATGTRLRIVVQNIVVQCGSGVTGTIGWDFTDVDTSAFYNIGVDRGATTDGFLEGIKVYSVNGAYRNTFYNPFVETRQDAAAIGINLSGVGTGGVLANSTHIFGGTVRALDGTQVRLHGDQCLLSGMTLEGEADYGIDIVSDATCRTNLIQGCRFENTLNTAIRIGALAVQNMTLCNSFSSGIPTKVNDISGENSIFEPWLFTTTMDRGHFVAKRVSTITQAVFDADMTTANYAFGARISTTYPLWGAKGSGRMGWGSGSADFDISLVRSATSTLKMELGCWESLIVQDGITAPTATSGQAKIYVDAADGDLKIVFGDGTVKTIVTDT